MPRGNLHRNRLPATRTTFDINARRLAEQLEAAQTLRRAIDPPQELARLSLSEAYDVQDAVVGRREAGGAARSGWKLGLTSAVKQRFMGIDRPVFGRTFKAGSIESGTSVGHATFIAPRTEPELAFGLREELEPEASLEALLRAVAWIAPALEITDSRYRPGLRSAVELIADNTSSAAYVIGAPVAIERAPEIARFETVIVRNGVVVGRGSSGDVLGDPVVGLRLLARHLAERGLRTAPGDIVLSGAITDACSVAPGDRVEARLAELGIAGVEFL